ncbi:hypothetical protein D4764_12G0000850 [Takifugu flavidus]|uniref:Uncharacterized protein n=1 Tax=Takifugu flavidus TaxID=433684 RepID=A0A5C6PBG2_9TELE|nr:hypothetical protein D4764_12G0000850 [Takifugu flavidus]
MSCFWRILLNFSETPDRPSIHFIMTTQPTQNLHEESYARLMRGVKELDLCGPSAPSDLVLIRPRLSSGDEQPRPVCQAVGLFQSGIYQTGGRTGIASQIVGRARV